MGGYAPKTRAGLIALIAMRRVAAERIRRETLAAAKSPQAVNTWSRPIAARSAQQPRAMADGPRDV